MLKVQSFTFNPFQENTYVVFDETRECVIVDPGCADREETNLLTSFIRKEDLQVRAIINTHCHIDHVLGNYDLKTLYNVPLWIHRIEEPYLRAVSSYAPNYGFFSYAASTPDGYLDEPESVQVGAHRLEVLFVPGHSPGHIALYHEGSGFVIAGDVLFRNSIGRTDLPGGNFETLINSIHHKLFQLPDDTIVYCGHGTETTVGYEKQTNPYCATDR